MAEKGKKVVSLSGHGKLKLPPHVKESFEEIERLLPPRISPSDFRKIGDLVVGYIIEAGKDFRQEELIERVRAFLAVKYPPFLIPQGIIPYEREKFKQVQLAFGDFPRILKEPQRALDSEGREISFYSKEIPGGTLTWQFYADIVKQEVLDFSPSLRNRARRLWFCFVCGAKKQRTLKVSLTASEIGRMQGKDPTKGGRFFSDVREDFYSLVFINPGFSNNKKGAARREWGFSFGTSWSIEGEGRETRYTLDLNPEALGMTELWALGMLTPEVLEELKQQGRYYVPIEVENLQRALPPLKDNLMYQLLLVPPKKHGYSVSGLTFLRDWCKAGDDLLRRPQDCQKMLYDMRTTGKKERWFRELKITIRGRALKDWEVRIFKDSPKAKSKKPLSPLGDSPGTTDPRTPPTDNEEEEDDNRLTPEEIEAQLDRLQKEGELNAATRALLEITLRTNPYQNTIDSTLEEVKRGGRVGA